MNDIETTMADLVLKESPEAVAEFLAAMQEDGMTQEEIMELRQQVYAVLQNRDSYPEFVDYLVSTGFINEEEVPPQFEIGFVMTILGLVGVAQRSMTS